MRRSVRSHRRHLELAAAVIVQGMERETRSVRGPVGEALVPHRPRDPLDAAALGGHDEDVGVRVLPKPAGERDRSPVRRPRRVGGPAGQVRQPSPGSVRLDEVDLWRHVEVPAFVHEPFAVGGELRVLRRLVRPVERAEVRAEEDIHPAGIRVPDGERSGAVFHVGARRCCVGRGGLSDSGRVLGGARRPALGGRQPDQGTDHDDDGRDREDREPVRSTAR